MDDNMESAGSPWIDEMYDSPLIPTEVPGILGNEETTIGMLVIIIVAAIFTIILLFIIAVFIDCRHQKLINKKAHSVRKVLKMKLPPPLRRIEEDEENIIDPKNVMEPTTSHIV